MVEPISIEWQPTQRAPRLALRRPLRFVCAFVAVVAVMSGFTFVQVSPAGAQGGPVLAVPSCAMAQTGSVGRFVQAVPIKDETVVAPPVTSRSAVVIDAESGRVLYDLRAHDRLAPASTTKIMTAILAIEHGDFDSIITSDIDASTMTDSSVMGLRIGDRISERDLLYGLMLPSGNDAAIELAKAVDGSVSAFVGHMNAKARELRLEDTHFENPHGLDARGHYSSAYDLAMLARYGMQDPTFLALVSTQNWSLAPPLDYSLHNGNSLLESYPGADGVKIGWTDLAGWTFVASAQRDGHRLIVALMDTQDRDRDATALLDWGWAAHKWVSVDPATTRTLSLVERLGFKMPLLRALEACS